MLRSSEIQTVVSRLRTEGWAEGSGQVQNFEKAVTGGSISSTTFAQKITALSSSFQAFVTGAKLVASALGSLTNEARAAAQELEPFTFATANATEQVALFFSLSRSAGYQLTTEQISELQSNFNKLSLTLDQTTELTRIATIAQKELHIQAESLTSQFANAAQTGLITREMLASLGNITEEDRASFRRLGSEAQRVDFLMSKLTERFGEAEVSLGSIDDLLSAVENAFKTAVSSGIYVMVQALVGGEGGLEGSLSTIEDVAKSTIGVIVGLGGALGSLWNNAMNQIQLLVQTYNQYIRPVIQWISDNVPGFGSAGDILNTVWEAMPGWTGLGQIREAIQGYQEARAEFEASFNSALENTAMVATGQGRGGQTTRGVTRQTITSRVAEEERALEGVLDSITNMAEEEIAAIEALYEALETGRVSQLEKEKFRRDALTVSESQQQLSDEQQIARSENARAAQELGFGAENWTGNMLEKAFGKEGVQEFLSGEREMEASIYSLSGALTSFSDVASSSFSTFSQAFASSVVAVASGKKSISEAMLDLLESTLYTLGQEALVKAMFYTASAAASAVTPGGQLQAAGYLTAAGLYYGVAALGLGGGAIVSLARGNSGSQTSAQSGVTGSTFSQHAPSTFAAGNAQPEAFTFNIYYSGPSFATRREIDTFIDDSRKRMGVKRGSI